MKKKKIIYVILLLLIIILVIIFLLFIKNNDGETNIHNISKVNVKVDQKFTSRLYDTVINDVINDYSYHEYVKNSITYSNYSENENYSDYYMEENDNYENIYNEEIPSNESDIESNYDDIDITNVILYIKDNGTFDNEIYTLTYQNENKKITYLFYENMDLLRITNAEEYIDYHLNAKIYQCNLDNNKTNNVKCKKQFIQYCNWILNNRT